jgi:hypothetical protein
MNGWKNENYFNFTFDLLTASFGLSLLQMFSKGAQFHLQCDFEYIYEFFLPVEDHKVFGV